MDQGGGEVPAEDDEPQNEPDPRPRGPVKACPGEDYTLVWMVDAGDGNWIEVDPTWQDPIDQALEHGVVLIELQHLYYNRRNEEVTSRYTINLTDIDLPTQTNIATGRIRRLAAFKKMTLVMEET